MANYLLTSKGTDHDFGSLPNSYLVLGVADLTAARTALASGNPQLSTDDLNRIFDSARWQQIDLAAIPGSYSVVAFHSSAHRLKGQTASSIRQARGA